MAWAANDDGAGEMRRDGRDEVQFRAPADVAGGVAELLVYNLSASGLMARTDDAMAQADDPILIRLPGAGPTRGMVRWATAGRIGVEFDQPMPLPRYLDLLAAVLPRR